MSASTIYSLHYFDGRGRAEAIRLIFVQADQKFEDLRHTRDEWAKLKSQMPLGQIPVLGTLI
jgi:glutathione S-transferase